MFVRVNAIFNTWGVILHEGRIGGLERLVEEGTILPVQFADWAAPIVPIVKEDKSIRICGDYKVTATKLRS